MRKAMLLLALAAAAAGMVWIGASTLSTSASDPEADGPADTTPVAQPELPLEDFLDQASLEVVLRSPETITYLGLAPALGLRDDALSPVTRAYELETIDLIAALLVELDRYDLSLADPDTALSARIYGWYLADQLEAYRLSDHAYSISTHLSSYPDTVERLLLRAHPMQSAANAEDYLARLGQIASRFDELIVRLGDSEAIGAVPPASILRRAAESIAETANSPTADVSYVAAFSERAASIEALSDTRKEQMLGEVSRVVQDSVLPAYRRLADAVGELADRVDDTIGVWRHTNGAEYYDYRLRRSTTTDASADDIHALGLQEVARIRAEIAEQAEALGISANGDIVALFRELADRSTTITGNEMVETCRQLLRQIPNIVRPAFVTMPEAEVEVIAGGTRAYFSPGTLDGSRPGRFVAPTSREMARYELPTLAYHEAFPGHGFQIALAHAAGLPAYRAGLSFTAYTEGWALYGERLAWELGVYRDDPSGNLGRLQAELFRAARLVVDTGIHAKRWSYDQAVHYLFSNTGYPEDYVRQEIERYIVVPGQATAYKMGMIKLLELRDQAQRELGDRFDLAAFHQVVLDQGSVPLSILEELVDAYISRVKTH